VYPKNNPPGFFGYVPGCLNPATRAGQKYHFAPVLLCPGFK